MTAEPTRRRFRSKRFILRERGIEDVVRSLAEAFGWSVIRDRPADKKRDVARALIWEIIPGLTVGYYDEPLAEASCLIVHSVHGPVEVHEFETILTQNLDFVEDSELLAAVSASKPGSRGYILSLLRLGLGAPSSFDQQYFDQLSMAMQNAKPAVRIAVLRGITFTEWPDFRPILQRTATSDSDRSVRELAGRIISVFDSLGLEDES
jgi:hypothetical protein